MKINYTLLSSALCVRLTARCPRESGPFIVLQQTYSPYMSATNLSQILTKSALRTLIYSLPLFFLLFLLPSLTNCSLNQYPFSYIFGKFLFSENTVASQRWFLLHSQGVGRARTRILFSGLPSHSGLHRGLSGAPCAGCFHLLSILVNSKKHLLRPSTRSGIALVSGRRGKRVENETACQRSKSSKPNERYSHKKNTSQVQLRVS